MADFSEISRLTGRVTGPSPQRERRQRNRQEFGSLVEQEEEKTKDQPAAPDAAVSKDEKPDDTAPESTDKNVGKVINYEA